MNDDDQRPLRHSAQRERNLLGALFVGNPLSLEILAIPTSHFYIDKNRKILEALREMASRGIPFGLANLFEYLERSGKLQAFDVEDISSLGDGQHKHAVGAFDMRFCREDLSRWWQR